MAQFGRKSNEKIDQCHSDWRAILDRVIKIIDLSVYEGHRPVFIQQELYAIGRTVELDRKPVTKIDGVRIKGKHNYKPSLAIDCAPYPISFSSDSKKVARFYYLAGVIKAVATELKKEGLITSTVRWGGDWDGDNDFEDQTFDDLCHFELKFD